VVYFKLLSQYFLCDQRKKSLQI